MLPLKDYIQHPATLLLSLLYNYGSFIPDKLYLQLLYRLRMGYWPDLKSPKTFNEKLQWLKLYDRQPEYKQMVDKAAVKDYVANIIGHEHIIPMLGVWERPEDIEWDTLPKQFVLKTTHGGGNTGVIICKDKTNFDKEKAIKKLNQSLKQDLYRTSREWPYKSVPRRIIAEQFIEAENDDLPDYKFFCFDGVIKALFVGTDRGTGNVKFDYFDADFNHLDLIQIHPMSGKQIKKPVCFEKMKEIASRLSKGIPHVRIDLYEVRGKIYFGEFTFYHHGGFVPFHPEIYDLEWGKMISLSNNNEVKD